MATKGKKKLDKLNETGKRSTKDRREGDTGPASGPERRKTKRRRQIDPTTCEREYNDAEIEFMHALDEYKRASGRMFPTCSEILEVIVGLGYRRVAEPSTGFSMDNAENASTKDELACELEDTELQESA